MRSAAPFGVLLTAALAAGSLGLPAAARASGAPVPASLLAAIPSVPCDPAGVSAGDVAIAERVRSAMTGRRLGRSVSGYNISCARAIVRHVHGRGLPSRAAVIAVTTAIAESTLHNYSVAVDHDSLGLFQQRPSTGWGQPQQLVDPGFATNAFLNKLIRTHPANSWMTGDIGQISQRVQVSAYPAAYTPEAPDAQVIVGQLWTDPGTPTPPAVVNPPIPTPAPAPPAAAGTKKPAPASKGSDGAFQKSLLRTRTAHGPLDDRHQVFLADWDVDGHPDLVVVQQSGTPSGGTWVHILKGVSHYQHSLLLTATVLGATDARHSFSVADWNADGRPDLIVTQKAGTASGRTEVRVLDGATNLQRYLQETPTILGATDARHTFSMADYNADGRPDLIVTQKAGTASGRTEVRVLDGATNLQRFLQETPTILGATDARHTFSMADYNGDLQLDLVVTQKSGTAGNRTGLQVLDGASKFQRFLVKSSTAPIATDDRHQLSTVDWNGDGRLDLVVTQKSGTVSGQVEAHILAG